MKQELKTKQSVDMRIYKYQLQITDEQTILLPRGAEILTVQCQNNILCLWAMVNPENPEQKRYIEIIGTGNPIDVGNRRYIGSAQQYNGKLIWHVFELIK